MVRKTCLLLILFQGLIKIAVFCAEEDSISSRSAFFTTQENKQLKGYVLKVFKSHSLMSCSQSCLRNAWCTSTNFKVSSIKDGKGTCELNKREIPLINENTKFHDQQGVTFSMLLKGCLMSGCLNGGSCLSDGKTETFSCSCKLPWIGDKCEVKLPQGCQSYKHLTNADRKTTYRSSRPFLCDQHLGPDWFRFQGDAGTRMATSSVPRQRCGARAPGWLNGTHPKVADGIVTRQVCFPKFDWAPPNPCSTGRSINISVINCGSYFVYYLHGTPSSSCSLRYCSTDHD